MRGKHFVLGLVLGVLLTFCTFSARAEEPEPPVLTAEQVFQACQLGVRSFLLGYYARLEAGYTLAQLLDDFGPINGDPLRYFLVEFMRADQGGDESGARGALQQAMYTCIGELVSRQAGVR